MDTIVESKVYIEQWNNSRVHKTDTLKKNFEEAVAACDGRPASEFFNELRRQVQEHFKNA